MVSADVDTEAALDAMEFPIEAIVDCAAMRTALFEAALALDAPALVLVSVDNGTTLFMGRKTLLDTANVGLSAEALAEESDCPTAGPAAAAAGDTASDVAGVTEPALSCVVCEPLAYAPEVETHIRRKIEGRAKYCGAASGTT